MGGWLGDRRQSSLRAVDPAPVHRRRDAARSEARRAARACMHIRGAARLRPDDAQPRRERTLHERDPPRLVYSERAVFIGGFATGPLFGWFGQQWRSGKMLAGALLVAAALCFEPFARRLSLNPIRYARVTVAEVAAGTPARRRAPRPAPPTGRRSARLKGWFPAAQEHGRHVPHRHCHNRGRLDPAAPPSGVRSSPPVSSSG